MEIINIGGKPHKVSKAVKEYIELLRVQLEAKKSLASQIEGHIDTLKAEQSATLDKIEAVLDEIKNYY